MPIKQAAFNIKGMVRDLATSKFNPDYAFENKNMRLITTDENSASVLTSERGNTKVTANNVSISGIPIGQAQLDDELILFTTGNNKYNFVSRYLIESPYSLNSLRLYTSNDTSSGGYSFIDSADDEETSESEDSQQEVGTTDDDDSFIIRYFETSAYSGYIITRNIEEEVENPVSQQKIWVGIYDAEIGGNKYVINPPENGGYLIIVTDTRELPEASTIYYCSGIPGISNLTDESLNTFLEDSALNFSVYIPSPTIGASSDVIYRLKDEDGEIKIDTLYQGNLNFDAAKPIECITVYENESIKKVYWTDGLNQPRFINVAKNYISQPNDIFDFLRKIKPDTEESVTITKNMAVNGSFAPGTIQYLFSYYNLYGQQSKIFYTSPLYYISYNDRGAAEDDTVSVSFNISISSLNTDYDYLRIYSLQRTSINSTPIARKVADIKIEGSAATYTDLGDRGSLIEPTSLLYIGGENITAGTLVQKDNTLFLGDVAVKNTEIGSALKATIKAAFSGKIHTGIKNLSTEFCKTGDYYYYDNQLVHHADEITTFKLGEVYRVGIQLQDEYGKWSSPIFLSDEEISIVDSSAPYIDDGGEQKLFKIYAKGFSALTSLEAAGFVKIRPVIVYPTLSDRSIICQGVLCPTVYNAEDRYKKFPDVQSSWFFRPEGTDAISEYPSNQSFTRSTMGKYLEFRHNYPIPGNNKSNSEIQCIINPPHPYLGDTNSISTGFAHTEPTNAEEWVNANKECFYIDQSIVTFHSPDIEFDKNIRNLNLDNAQLRIVGWVPITSNITDINIETSTPPLNFASSDKSRYPEMAHGFYKKIVSSVFNKDLYPYYSIASGVYWLDEFYGTSVDNTHKANVGFVVYPWNRTGSLNNTSGAIKEDEVISAQLKRKVMSQLHYSRNSVYFSSDNYYWSPSNGIHSAIFDLEENDIIKIKQPDNSYIGDIIYKGNVDSVITFHKYRKNLRIDGDTDNSVTESSSAFYPIIAVKTKTGELVANNRDSENDNFKLFNENDSIKDYFKKPYTKIKEYDSNDRVKLYVSQGVHSCSNNPVSMKYKSTPHAVIAMNYTNGGKQIILPAFNPDNKIVTGEGSPGTGYTSYTNTFSSHLLFWDKNSSDNNKEIKGLQQDVIKADAYSELDLWKKDHTGILWLAELTQAVPSGTRFGGDSDEAIANNDWLPAGPEILIHDITSDTELKWTRGDTYYQRYDCLKTYPYTQEDENSIVDILSFMCETRINIDGRYDRNRGQNSNLYITPNNFNLLNPVYSQKDNFFTYKSENLNKVQVQNFPNTITWTKTKTLGEEIDSWTDVTLASTLDLDGSYGKITALRKFNDNLLAFQDKGISQILYNENVQISTSSGVPIEIANSGKVQGARTLSNLIGCTNKKSICSTPSGIYFINDLSKDICVFNGGFQNVSEKYGMHSWVQENLTKKQKGPFSNGCITYYDSINKELLFVTQTDCLAFSEAIGAFTSFYDYDRTLGFGKIKNRMIAIHQDDSDDTSIYYPYIQQNNEEYNLLFGKLRPYWTTVVANPNPLKDKIFNNIEFQADVFDATNKFITSETFDSLSTWNEYQEGFISLQSVANKPSSLKKKFRMWRANIPRWNINKNGIQPNYRDRMRNPWLFIKLSKEEPTNNKLVLHNILVNYFE